MNKEQAKHLKDFIWMIFGSILNGIVAAVAATVAYLTYNPAESRFMMAWGTVAFILCASLAGVAGRVGKKFVASFTDKPAAESQPSES